MIVSVGFSLCSGSRHGSRQIIQPKRFHRNEKFDDGGTQKNSGANSLFTYFCLETQISVTMPETL